MKICPTCSEVYRDDDINFCLADGTTLLKKKHIGRNKGSDSKLGFFRTILLSFQRRREGLEPAQLAKNAGEVSNKKKHQTIEFDGDEKFLSSNPKVLFTEGHKIGPYFLIRKLGHGGFGEVWLAERRARFVTTKVAVKLPRGDQIDYVAIMKEATLWEQASGHPNVVPIIDADEYDGQVVIVSEFAPNGSLDEWLKRNGSMPVEKAVETTIKILDGLAFLHSRNIIHRDLKPANILLRGETPLLADFGISRLLIPTAASQSENISGTFAYMSPEALDGKRSVQTDVWSVGVSLYQFLTNSLPFPQKEPSVLFPAIIMREYEPLPNSVPHELQRVVSKALMKQPEQRYLSALSMQEDLRHLLSTGLAKVSRQVTNTEITQGNLEVDQSITATTVVKIRKSNENGYSPLGKPAHTNNVYPSAVLINPLSPTWISSSQDFANYKLPDPSLLTEVPAACQHKESELREIAALLVKKTAEFNVPGKVVHISPGPVVTTFEFKPDAGVKYSRVTGLVDDLCLALKAPSIRIDRIPGKAFVGIEVPNHKRETIFLREVFESVIFKDSASLLTLGLGKSIDGAKYVADLGKMPHLLIAGATGAGKSVGINTLVMSILYKARPDDVKFIMVDPKQVELGLYADIPHLATPIITDPKRASTALRWAVAEMEKRYKELAKQSVRNIAGYNEKIGGFIAEERLDDNGDPYQKLPYIVIIIDEFAELMKIKELETRWSIQKLAATAHTVGVHLILSTASRSSEVLTQEIKENFHSRIAFRTVSQSDSRAILDSSGAEYLLGRGDMLFLPPGQSNVIRVHGAYVDEDEINKVVEFVKAQGRPEYDTTITKTEEELDDTDELPGRRDPLFMDALKTVAAAKRASTSHLQRHLRIGYGRAAAILDAMVREGYIGEMDGASRARPVLPKAYEDLQDLSEMENEL